MTTATQRPDPVEAAFNASVSDFLRFQEQERLLLIFLLYEHTFLNFKISILYKSRNRYSFFPRYEAKSFVTEM